MILDKSKIKLYSNVGSRASFGLACLDLVKENENLIVLTTDVSKTMQHGQKYYLPIKKEKLSKVSNKKNTSSETWSNKCHY